MRSHARRYSKTFRSLENWVETKQCIHIRIVIKCIIIPNREEMFHNRFGGCEICIISVYRLISQDDGRDTIISTSTYFDIDVITVSAS